MAVQDPPPPPQQPTTHPQVQRLIDAAQVGAAVRAAGAATVAPSVAVAAPAVAAGKIVSAGAEGLAHAVKIALVLRVLRRLLRRRRTESASALEIELRKRFPDLDPTVIQRIVQQEMRYEEAFGRKAEKRVDVDLQKAGQLDKDAQKKRIAEILAREKHYTALREKAMWDRAIAHGENERVRLQSPLGAKWVLGAAKNHTAGCLALAGRNWPWAVLDTIPPPLHTNCRCSLQPLGPNDTVPPAGEAMAMARRAMALEEAVRAVADPGEVAAYLAGEVVRPAIERALDRVNGEVFHQGEWLTLAEAKAPPTGTMIALYPTPSVASKLALKGGEPKDEIHMTLAFLGKADKLPDPEGLKQAVADWAARTPPLDGEISGHGLFTAGPEPVTYVSPDLPGLPEARADLADALEQGEHPLSKDHGFTPHMTIAYTDRTKDLPDHGGRRVGFSKASLVIGGERHDFKLAGKLQEATYEEVLHPRGRGGKWIAKLGEPKLKLKGDKKLTLRQTHSAVKRVAEGLVDFYGGDKADVEAHHEPDYMADVGGVARFRHPGELMAGINYGQGVMETVRDPEYGVHDLRIVAHEAAHSLSGTRPGPLPGFSQTFEEGGAEILSLWFWHHRAQPFDHRDAIRPVGGKWSAPGVDSLAHSVVYRNYVDEFMRRAASKVGWDRTKIVDEVERVMRGDHTVRLHFRDETDPEFPLPKDLPRSMGRTYGNEDSTDHAPELIKWLIDTDPAKLTSGATDDRSREAKGGGAAGSVGGRGRDLVGFGEVDVQAPAGRERYLAGLQANPQAGFITDPGEELAGKRAFLSADGKVGVTVSGTGEVGNLFRNEGAPPGSGGAAVDHAVANGGTWLNAFDGALPKNYAKHGFVEVARLRWDPGQEPDAWNHERYDAPDVVFMRHGGVAQPGNYVKTWDDAEAATHAAKLQEAFDETLHPRDRYGKWSFLGRLHTLTRSDIEAGHVPGVQVAGLASGVAGHAGLGGRPITLAPSSFDKEGLVSSVLLAHEAGHHLVNTVIKDGKVPPEMVALRAGTGRAAGRYGAMAGNAHLFSNPWKVGERDLPEEMIADGYADLLHGGAEFRYDGPPEPEPGTKDHEYWAADVAKDRAAFEETPRVKLLKVIAAAAREKGMPDHALYGYEFSGPMNNRQARLVLREADLREAHWTEFLHPRNRSGKWVDAIQHAETTHAEPSVHEGFTGEDFATALSGFQHGGITALRGNRTETQNLYGDVWLNLHKPGGSTPVGLVRVTLKPPDHRGQRTAVIENVFLKESEQNKGFGRAFTDHLFKTLRDGGVDRVALEAISVGGYSWARRGLVWDGDHAAEQRRILQDAKNDGRWDRIKDWPGADELERKLLAGEFSSEAELAAYGQSRWTEVAQPQDQMTGYTQPERERTRLGKELLIGSRWKGSRPVVVQAPLQETRLLQERAEVSLVWDAAKHRRGWHGHFAEMLGELPKPSLRGRGGGEVHVSDGHHVVRTRHGYRVTRPNGNTVDYGTAEEAAKSVHDEYESARLEADVQAERAASVGERAERQRRKREEEVAEASKHTWYRFESPEIAHKLVADAADGKGELWGLPGYQGRGNAAVRAQPRRPADETIKHERANGRVLIEFHTKVTPDAGLDDNQPQHEWTPTASVQNRNAQRLGLQDLRLEEEKETKYGRSEVAKLRIHGVRIVDVGG